MSVKKIALLLALMLSSCTSLKDKGRLYFTYGHKVQGVEPVSAFLERMNTDQKLRDIMYGQIKSAHIVECTLLRNQIYVASLKSPDAEIDKAVKIIEPAYQENDQSFLMACDQVLASALGKNFLNIQHEYVAK